MDLTTQIREYNRGKGPAIPIPLAAIPSMSHGEVIKMLPTNHVNIGLDYEEHMKAVSEAMRAY